MTTLLLGLAKHAFAEEDYSGDLRSPGNLNTPNYTLGLPKIIKDGLECKIIKEGTK